MLRKITDNGFNFLLIQIIGIWTGWFLGLERVDIPLLSGQDFGVTSYIYILSFISAFGISKAISNGIVGKLSDRGGRKKYLLLGWIIGIPVPFIFLLSTSWIDIVLLNLIIGASQAFTWTMAITATVDLSKKESRGLAVGINEAFGYIGEGSAAFITAYLSTFLGLKFSIFIFSLCTVIISLVVVEVLLKETKNLAYYEEYGVEEHPENKILYKKTPDRENVNYAIISQSGFFEKFGDVLMWGLFPIMLFTSGYGIVEISIFVAIYQFVWGIPQIMTGNLSDKFGRKNIIFTGMILLSISLVIPFYSLNFWWILGCSFMAGLGMSLLYPTLIAASNDIARPTQRGRNMGGYRFWRDLGYAVGGILVGYIAIVVGIRGSFLLVALIIFASSIIFFTFFKDNTRERSV